MHLAVGLLWLLFVLQLLLKPKFSGVEKIKTIGSTYMAAAGLSVPSGHENQVFTPHVRGNSRGRPQTHPLKSGCLVSCPVRWAKAHVAVPGFSWWWEAGDFVGIGSPMEEPSG
jgi:hypothetical protein